LRIPIIDWYHNNLCHPGAKRTERTIRQRLVWPGLSKDVEAYVKNCDACQRCKQRPKYGQLPAKDVDIRPWHTVCVDQVGPYTVKGMDGLEYTLNAMTMADPSTGWFEIAEVKDKTAVTAATVLDRVWLCRYPRPVECIYDNGNEFLGREFQEMLESYNIKPTPTTVKNPQANFVERVHQTLGNMLRTQELEQHEFSQDDPWADVLAKCSWAIRATVSLVSDATPAQLVFGRDMLFDLSFQVDWNQVRARKEAATEANNSRENSRRLPHRYQVGDQVLLDRNILQRKLSPPRDGPYEIETVYSNGVVKIKKGITSQKVSIRRITPYRSAQHNSGSE
jgi:hypothetical protein